GLLRAAADDRPAPAHPVPAGERIHPALMVRSPRHRSHGQSMVEFSLTVGLPMLLIVATVQIAIFLHYRSSLQLAAQEGAFEGSLSGHGPADATSTADSLWAKLEPGAPPARISASVQGDLVVVEGSTSAPALLP